MSEMDIASIVRRLDRLETKVFGQVGSATDDLKKKPKASLDSHSGPSGGVRLLIERDYFSSKKTLADVRGALVSEGYHYRDSAIQTALKRVSGKKGLLVSMKEAGKKVYALRK